MDHYDSRLHPVFVKLLLDFTNTPPPAVQIMRCQKCSGTGYYDSACGQYVLPCGRCGTRGRIATNGGEV